MVRAKADGTSARSTGHKRARLAALGVAFALLCAPVALADETRLDGSPIDVWSNGSGQLQFRYDGYLSGQFFDPVTNEPNAGLLVLIDGDSIPWDRVTTVSGPTVTTLPDGRRALQSTYDVGTYVRVNEQLAYRDGTQTADAQYTLTNITPDQTLDVRAGLLADLYVAGNDVGTGVLTGTAPNRFIGGRSSSGVVSGLTEITPWSAYQESGFTADHDIFDDFNAGGLKNTINPDFVDNMLGVQWNLGALAPGQAQTVQTSWTLGQPPEDTKNVVPGTFGTLPPPVPGKKVNLKLLSGTVLYKPPGAKKFLKLTDDVQVPVGTTLDTLKGRVSITAASDLKGGTNKSWFYSGVFKVTQALAAKPVTELQLTGAKLSCKKASAAAKKPKTRKLWGDGSGSFRTRGSFSSATVRGTKWLVIDRCDGTLTRVVRGVVTVRDFVKGKTVIVRAGKQYLARKKRK
jgi:hypothetical protein